MPPEFTARCAKHLTGDKKGEAQIFLDQLSQAFGFPGAKPLKETQAALDVAVLSAYDSNANEDLLSRLLALNLKTAAKIGRGEPATASGVPKHCPDPKQLMTEDCIKPATGSIREAMKTLQALLGQPMKNIESAIR